MRSRFVLLAVALTFSVVFAEITTVRVPCSVCRGRRSLTLTPPNLGQYDGEISVTPGKPFTTHRWDVKYDRCPICDGQGWIEKYKTRVKAPKPEDVEGLAMCPNCRWSGVVACRKCVGTGLQTCAGCRNAAGRGSRPGWIKTEKRTSGATSRHVKILVTPCGTCLGVGKVVCPDCMGHGATPCRKCQGTGGIAKKETR